VCKLNLVFGTLALNRLFEPDSCFQIIDLDSIEKELLSIKEALEYLRAAEESTHELVAKIRIPCYHIENEELVRRSELIRQV